MYETHYGLLKSGEIRQYKNRPKRKHVHVKTYRGPNPQNTAHYMNCDGIVKTFIAHCGYDRGPRLENIIRGMLI